LLSVPVYPFAELVEILRAGVLGDPAKRPGSYTVVERDAHRPPFDIWPVRMFPFQDRVIALRVHPPKITFIGEHLRHVVAAEIPL